MVGFLTSKLRHHIADSLATSQWHQRRARFEEEFNVRVVFAKTVESAPSIQVDDQSISGYLAISINDKINNAPMDSNRTWRTTLIAREDVEPTYQDSVLLPEQQLTFKQAVKALRRHGLGVAEDTKPHLISLRRPFRYL